MSLIEGESPNARNKVTNFENDLQIKKEMTIVILQIVSENVIDQVEDGSLFSVSSMCIGGNKICSVFLGEVVPPNDILEAVNSIFQTECVCLGIGDFGETFIFGDKRKYLFVVQRIDNNLSGAVGFRRQFNETGDLEQPQTLNFEIGSVFYTVDCFEEGTGAVGLNLNVEDDEIWF